MRRLSTIAGSLLALFLMAGLAFGQERANPLDPIFDFFKDPGNEEFVARFLKDPVEDRSHVVDPSGDFEHSTGEPPGYTPAHLDITEAWAVHLDPGPIGLFGPTNENGFWAPTGPFEVSPPNSSPFTTFTGDIKHDGSQFAGGAILFGFYLADTPPVEVAGRCEFVVWVNDASRGATFVNAASFPRDPAGGTNVAYGLGINPEGQGLASTFTLDLQKTGGFAPDFDVDVRSFITPDYVGLLVPKDQIGLLAGINFYTFCVEEGFSFSPQDTGSDQTGLIELTPDDLGQLVVESVPTAAETTTTEAPTTTPPPTTPTTVSPPTTRVIESSPTADDGAFPWWLVLLGGLGLAVLGWWLYSRGDPCKELRDAWLTAQAACEEAQRRADEAADECMEAEFDLEDLEDERKEACRAWPPACWTTEDGGWVEDDQGNRITSRDLHMRQMALGEVWSDYKAGKMSAQEVEAKWKEMDTPEFREEMRETDEAFKDLLDDIDADIAEADQAAKDACDRAAEAQQAADEACGAAAAARKAYEECVGAAIATAASGGETGGDEYGPAGPSGPSVASGSPSEPADPCKDVDPKRKYENAGSPDRIRVTVDFSIIIGRYEGSERNVAAGEQLVMNLNDLARDLDFAGDMLNARSAGLHIGGAATGYAQGKYVATAAGVVKGGIDATMATTDLVPDVPTTPLQAGTELLEKTAELGAFVAGKVTEWMTNYQIFTVRRSFFYQFITATPYNILECRTGQGWVCVEKVWEFEVGKLQVLKGRDRWFTMNSSVRRAQFESEVRRLSQSAASTIKNDARLLAEWRARHEPGPCR